MLKNLSIIPSRTSQKFYPLLSYAHIIIYIILSIFNVYFVSDSACNDHCINDIVIIIKYDST